MKIIVIAGTRPEAIKLAPVVLALRQRRDIISMLVSSGQHREMCIQALAAFSLSPDHHLDTMVPGQSLGQLSSRLFAQLDALFEREQPDWVVVQGDTTSAMVASLCAFYRRIAVAHVEAGLRTYDKWAPFPEEINRSFIGHVADVHFAPTEASKQNLLRAGVADKDVLVTGNTVVDAVRLLRPGVARRDVASTLHLDPAVLQRRLILVTSHRREALGDGLRNICMSLLDLVRRFEDVEVVFPVHLNPLVRGQVHEVLKDQARIHLRESLEYLDILALVEHSTLVLTDSGGLQEEVPSFGKPILILRDVTERPEVVEVGAARLVGTSRAKIRETAIELLTDNAVYKAMSHAGNPFGDGHAAERIAKRLAAASASC